MQTQSSDDIMRETENTRAGIEKDLDALEDRLAPGEVLDQIGRAVEPARDGAARFARNLGDTVREQSRSGGHGGDRPRLAPSVPKPKRNGGRPAGRSRRSQPARRPFHGRSGRGRRTPRARGARASSPGMGAGTCRRGARQRRRTGRRHLSPRLRHGASRRRAGRRYRRRGRQLRAAPADPDRSGGGRPRGGDRGRAVRAHRQGREASLKGGGRREGRRAPDGRDRSLGRRDRFRGRGRRRFAKPASAWTTSRRKPGAPPAGVATPRVRGPGTGIGIPIP